jgi:hypothetical protein
MSSIVARLRDRGNVERAPDRFLHQGQPYPFDVFPASSMPGSPVEVGRGTFEESVKTLGARSSIVNGAIDARSSLMTQITFKFRDVRDVSRLFGTEALLPLERPAPDTTRHDLLARVEPDIAHHGNFYARRTPDGRVRRLRPDWVQILVGSNERVDDPMLAADAELVGYVYKPGGRYSDHPGQLLAPTEVAHWAPRPHPTAVFMGEAWLTAVWREIAADLQATDQVSKFFENASTANMVIKPPEAVNTPEMFEEWVDVFDGAHRGARNAFKNIYVQAGSDVAVVGADLGKLGMEDLQGGFETRVSSASRVPATVALFREGNKGSSMNGGNYGQIRRMWADGWFSPYAEGFCASMARIVNVPADSELTFDPERVLMLQEDQKDAAEIRMQNAGTMRTLADAGWKPDATVEFVRNNGDLRRLIGQHTGLPSVQVQQATTGGQEAT